MWKFTFSIAPSCLGLFRGNMKGPGVWKAQKWAKNVQNWYLWLHDSGSWWGLRLEGRFSLGRAQKPYGIVLICDRMFPARFQLYQMLDLGDTPYLLQGILWGQKWWSTDAVIHVDACHIFRKIFLTELFNLCSFLFSNTFDTVFDDDSSREDSLLLLLLYECCLLGESFLYSKITIDPQHNRSFFLPLIMDTYLCIIFIHRCFACL